MPTPATTHLTISALLDLVGQTTAVQHSGGERGAFDALLQAPAAPRKHAEAPPSEYEEQAYREEDRAPPPEVENQGNITDAAHDARATAVERDDEQPNEGDERNSTAEEPLDEVVEEEIHEVNAALAVTSASVVPLILPAASDYKSENGTAGGVLALVGEGAEGNSRRSAKSIAPEASLPAVTPQVAAKTAVRETKAEKQRVEGQKSTKDGAAIEAAALAPAVPDGEAQQSISQTTEGAPAMDLKFADSSDSPATLEVQAEGERADDSANARHDPFSAVEQATKIEATPVDQSQAQGVEAVPVVAPAQTPTASGKVAASPTEQTAAITSAATTKRSRLPAEVLTTAPASAKARGPVEVQSERLLTRVARALAAAEAREGEVRLRLSPPELGSLRLELKVQDGAMIAHVEAETETARAAIVENLPALRERLAEQGVRIERFDVDLMQRHAGGAPNQSDQRQSQESPGGLRVALPPRRTAEATVAAPIAASVAGSGASGLNVIV